MRTSAVPAARGYHPVRRVWILGNARNETNVDLVDRWSAAGVAASLLAPVDVGALVRRGDVVVGRIDVRRTIDGVEPGLLALVAAERRGARVVNSAAAILRAHDKLLTARALVRAGVPHPRTVHVRPGAPIPLPLPFVVKPRFGSWGVDVFRCDEPCDVARVFALIAGRPWFRRQGAIVQELVPPGGYDGRVLVAGGAVAGGERRVAATREWRNNISLGGAHVPAEPTREEKLLARAAAAALGGDFLGVDLLPTRSGSTVLEANAAVEFGHGYSLDGVDVFGAAAAALGLQPRVARAAEAVLQHPAA
jgi:RimK family alpha-L-glutamate ligase